jgi:hypothetical protein
MVKLFLLRCCRLTGTTFSHCKEAQAETYATKPARLILSKAKEYSLKPLLLKSA